MAVLLFETEKASARADLAELAREMSTETRTKLTESVKTKKWWIQIVLVVALMLRMKFFR